MPSGLRRPPDGVHVAVCGQFCAGGFQLVWLAAGDVHLGAGAQAPRHRERPRRTARNQGDLACYRKQTPDQVLPHASSPAFNRHL
jgi:hypothetical protein